MCARADFQLYLRLSSPSLVRVYCGQPPNILTQMSLTFLPALLCLLAWLYLSFRHGSFWQPLLPETFASLTLPSVDIVIPARNEAMVLPLSLPSLLGQNYAGQWRVLLIDDHSIDGTSELAKELAEKSGQSDRLTVIKAHPLIPNWSGKVAAMNCGAEASKAEFILFTDADICHAPNHLQQLVACAETAQYDLVSRMVMLNCVSFAERLLIPAFVFFFAMLYPFRMSNDPRSKVAAAAGGVMLIRRAMLDKIGGLASIKSALIDDCSLAGVIKKAGGTLHLTLTRDAESLRPYPELKDIWKMVARTAFTQLRFSPYYLTGTVLGMILLFLMPPALVLDIPTVQAWLCGALSWLFMCWVYMPMVEFYRLPRAFALTLPLAALVYAAATLDSARLYYQGKGGQWKGRTQA